MKHFFSRIWAEVVLGATGDPFENFRAVMRARLLIFCIFILAFALLIGAAFLDSVLR